MLAAVGPLLLIGGGRMGEALLTGWRAHGLAADAVCVVEPDAERAAELAATLGVMVCQGADRLPAELRPEVVVVAVKPQLLDTVLPAYAGFRDALVVSIAAGKPLASLERVFGDGAALARAMSNTPAAVGRGVTVLFANRHCDAARRQVAHALMGAVGEVHWVDDEEPMHAVTAVSGSGPAYVFHLIEALAAAGVAAGLPEPLAASLAHATVVGAGELAHRSGLAADQLRRNVTSPGGTTAAALELLMADDGMTPLVTRAVAAAAARSRALA